MADFYEGIRSTVVAPLLKQYGQAMIFRVSTPGVYDPATGSTSDPVAVDYNCRGMKEAISSNRANIFYGSGELKGTLIQKDDEMVILSALDDDKNPIPKPVADQDVLVIGETTFQIAFVVPLDPAGTPVMFNLQVRK